jgi:8-oxo-dGTP pyrophosphatase MutT (NUDIX family)
MSKSKTSHFQYAALPYRRRDDAIEVMLITSRETKRWVIPKGWPGAGLPARASAEREAREEGGLVGKVGQRPIGRYHYKKRVADGSSVACLVKVFAMEVEHQLRSWPERKERRTRWFVLQQAADAVDEPELAAMIRDLPKRLARNGGVMPLSRAV